MKHFLLFANSLTKRKNWLALALLVHGLGFSQDFTDSNLPIVIINTDIDEDTGQPMEIPDDPKIWASMKIIYHTDGSRNYMTDADNTDLLDYNGRIKIEVRGSTSQILEKKQYGWTTYDDEGEKQKVEIMGMPSENDWILNGLAFDPALIRDYLSYNLARQMGRYATRTVYCEVVLNGDYRGLYILQEKIKDSAGRVNIKGIDEDDNEGINLTGGYITKADKTTGGDPVAWTMDSYFESTDFIHELPKPEDVTTEQNDYIHSVFTSLETTSGGHNSSATDGYPSIIDIPTFVDFMLVNELSANVDVYQISTFFHKDRGGKLRAGPVWDFNLTYGNDVFGDRSHTDTWQFSNEDNEGAKFWTDLFNDPVYKCQLAKRWNALTAAGQPLNNDHIDDFIDETVELISEAAEREQDRWNSAPNLDNDIQFMKTFITQRIAWMTTNLGSFTACETVTVPSLVISKINYNPGTSDAFPESDDQEFIAIKNTETEMVDLTGVYLSELGISYQFPAGSTIAAGETVYLVSDTDTFEARYDVAAFGQFARNLSNSTQKLVLADAFGNVIDLVEYDDDTPWPDADGNGSYMVLTDVSLDNNIGSNWTASSSDSLGTTQFTATVATVFPNPVNNVLHIQAAEIVRQADVYDISGKQLQSLNGSTSRLDIDFSGYAAGIYFIKIKNDTGMSTQKVVKQ
jgi:hypothetical protein